MPSVLFRCPLAEVLVPTGLEATARRNIPASGSIERCAACSRRHQWHRAETVIDGARPRQIRREIGSAEERA